MDTPVEPPTVLKLLLIGSSSVGKSSLLTRFTDEVFASDGESAATVGVDMKVKLVKRTPPGQSTAKTYKLALWDTAGQERFRTLTSSYYRGAHGVIVVYDVANRETFVNLDTWFQELETFCHNDIVRIVVGNKTDKEFARMVTAEEGQAWSDSRGCLFMECSAKQGKNVESLFDTVIDKIIENPRLYAAPRANRLPGGFNGDLVNLQSANDVNAGWCRC
ncbi:uncharacterized protein L969DRAFT_101429 [Mixia osmundae IAM 14324]|uniref:Ras-related protein Rab-18 n=1 Tax=Mixia osmundae (strain CBS 9802 / IAM 14324 / JCM 22182 / KY 12970) TaxID=764103 RepID=G7DXJ3_MIXOS|nr:uncharacterized protein L969DRAFT_101429 [Mixia osmundae IAM 14324]KEI41203.1 hypothetical protein L969DRAFT_101429 [Mixia osmundae IAM 14324]GAA95303.1 hypothetical protein E5Q_01960 [Mixia osmundae IAM 14324]